MQMNTIKNYIIAITAMLTVGTMFSACDKLGGDNAINEVLPGTWSFSYTTSEEMDVEFEYELIIFHADGNCAITYDGGEETGTYRAGDATVLIDALNLEEPMLWRVISFSPYLIVAEYDFESKGQAITATITLEKV